MQAQAISPEGVGCSNPHPRARLPAVHPKAISYIYLLEWLDILFQSIEIPLEWRADVLITSKWEGEPIASENGSIIL